MYLQCNRTAESAELFVNCLEAMVETCLPVEEGEGVNNHSELPIESIKQTDNYQVNPASNVNASALGVVDCPNVRNVSEEGENLHDLIPLDPYE